jgi:GH18 family chitinase
LRWVAATLFATSWYGNSYDPKLADQVDWLSIMSYDLTGSWNQSPVGPHTALLKFASRTSTPPNSKGSGRVPRRVRRKAQRPKRITLFFPWKIRFGIGRTPSL